jgi:hypothetical protein
VDPKDVKDGGDGTKKAAQKRKVPSLNSELLLSERGLDEIRKTFPTIKFRGPGHEAKDLHKLIDCYKDFFNNFYPKFNFHRVVKKCESLGKQGEVKAYMNEVRTDYKERHRDEILRAEEDEEQAERLARGEEDGSDIDEDVEYEPRRAPAAVAPAASGAAAPAPVLSAEELEEQKVRAAGSRAKALLKLAERKRAREEEEAREQEAVLQQEQEAAMGQDEEEAWDEMENLEEFDHPELSNKRSKADMDHEDLD